MIDVCQMKFVELVWLRINTTTFNQINKYVWLSGKVLAWNQMNCTFKLHSFESLRHMVCNKNYFLVKKNDKYKSVLKFISEEADYLIAWVRYQFSLKDMHTLWKLCMCTPS